MTSNPSAFNDGARIKDAASSSPLVRNTTANTFSSSNNRSSIASNETGESSTTASQRNSLVNNGMTEGSAVMRTAGSLESDNLVKDIRKSHRSHRSRASGGFLLSSATFPPTAGAGTELSGTTGLENGGNHQLSSQESKGKTPARSPEKQHLSRRSNIRASSPLANKVSNAANEDRKKIDNHTAADNAKSVSAGVNLMKAAIPALDVDSAQIVNLALNLSESRRNASRRIVSTPLPQASGALGESTVGGSLRQHLQQQRRASRNISPKPDKGERTMASSRFGAGHNVHSPLQSVFDSPEDGHYEYHFSPSTLARAEKARNAIELMAQYRRLLQYVPPLKPQVLETTATASDAGSPTSSNFGHSRSASTAATAVRQLGRPYNPLQYIRNRKVRARTSRTIDGEAQGFGELEKVSSWVDLVARESSTEEYQRADCAVIPRFSKAAEDAASPFGSPQSSASKSQSAQVKFKRPRVDWITNPADMLADIFWTEQDDNKKLVEDRSGHPIFPQDTELKRPMSRRSDEHETRKSPIPLTKREELGLDLKLDTQLPEFKSLRSDSERMSDWAAHKAKQKLRDVRDVARIHHHRHNSSSRDRHLLRSRSRSDSDSSEDDIVRPPRRKRSGTADSHDRGKDILEKQMMEMIAREARQADFDEHEIGSQRVITSIEPNQEESASKIHEVKGHSRSSSLLAKKRNSVRNGSSGRASLEVPGVNPRTSLDGLDTTAPSSPFSRATKLTNAFIPSIGMDLSPTGSRPTSPTRRPLSRMGSKIRPLYSRSDEPSRHPEMDDGTPFVFPSSKEQPPETPKRTRSMSPPKKLINKMTDESQKFVKNAGSIRRGKGEESGIRGLFKGPRNTVSKVSDYLWKKDASPGVGTASGFSTDESDIEDLKKIKSEKKESHQASVNLPNLSVDELPPHSEIPSRLADMPSFTSPFEGRGRPSRVKSDEISSQRNLLSEQQRETSDRRRSSRSNLLDAPRIDVQNASPSSSPDTGPINRFHRDSSVSDISSYHQGVQNADARLSSILGIPGKRRNALPVTGLSSLQTSSDTHPSLEGHRQWSISDISVNQHRSPMTKREIARVRALLLSSGIKAKEISRRAAEPRDLRNSQEKWSKDIASLTEETIEPVPKSLEHRLAARILSEDIQVSARLCQRSAENFNNTTVATLLSRIGNMQTRLVDNLTPMTRSAGDEADEVTKDLVSSQTLQVKRISDKMDMMMRRRRRRFRWVRRGGWVLVEWALVGVMWGVWFVVMLIRILLGIGNGIVSGMRWLFWL